MTLLKELVSDLNARNIMYSEKKNLGSDGWKEGEVDRLSIYDECEDWTLVALLDAFEELEAGVDPNVQDAKEVKARLRILGHLIGLRLGLAQAKHMHFFIERVEQLVQVVQEQKAEIDDIRNTLKKHQHPTLGGLYTGRAEWV